MKEFMKKFDPTDIGIGTMFGVVFMSICSFAYTSKVNAIGGLLIGTVGLIEMLFIKFDIKFENESEEP